MVAVAAYVVVVGGGASIVRAGVMAELMLAAWLVGRLGSLRHGLLASAALLVWAWPGVYRTLGFQLSYACVLALVAWAGPGTLWLRERGVPVAVGGAVVATASCTSITAPILLAATGSAPVLAGVMNLTAVPLAGMILLVGLPSCVAGLVNAAWAAPGLHLCAWLAGAVVWSANMALAMPLARTSSSLVCWGMPAAACWMRWRRQLERGVAEVERVLVRAVSAAPSPAAPAGRFDRLSARSEET
jgi:competence protein ComEC